MREASSPIGVIDSGLGGLTVVRQLKELYPNEDILYFGDNENFPYGNKNDSEIVALTEKMLDFLQEQGVKGVAIACNTVSTQLDKLKPYPFPVVGIISPSTIMATNLNIEQIGIIATPVTIKTNIYNKLITKKNPHMNVVSCKSENLAALINSGYFDYDAIDREIITSLESAGAAHLSHMILACTHYPIIKERFELCFPNTIFIDPAKQQVECMMEVLASHGLVRNGDRNGSFTYFTSGGIESSVFLICEKLGLCEPDDIHLVTI